MDWTALTGLVPAAWLPYVGKAAASVVIVVLAVVVNGAARRWLGRMRASGALSVSVESLIRLVVRWSLLLLALLLVLHQFDVLANVWAAFAAVLALVAVGFVAVWSVVSNVLCTVLILVFRPFAVGDEVELVPENVGGKVVDLNVLFTTLKAEDGSLVQLPNNLFFQKIVRRRPGPDGRVGLGEQLDSSAPAE